MKQWLIVVMMLVTAVPVVAWAGAPVPPTPVPGKPAAVAPVAAPVPPAASPLEEMRAAYKEAPLMVVFEVTAVDGREDMPQFPWQMTCTLVEPLKGKLTPGQFFVHVTSVAAAFDQTRIDVAHKDFIAMLKPLGAASDRRFVLVGSRAYPADGPQAQQLRQMAQVDGGEGTGGTSLKLDIAALAKNFPVAGPKLVEVRLTNSGADTASYLQSPIMEKDGKLYLTGQGMIRIRDSQSRVVPDKGNIVQGQMPPPPPTPTIILANANSMMNVDLSKYFDLPEGRYTLALAVATPDGRGKVSSGLLSMQVGGTPPPEVTLPAPKVAPVKPPEEPVAGTDTALPEVTPRRPAGPVVPDPSKYAPGKSYKGLAGLLRPTKAKFAHGEPVDIEFRLINDGALTIVADSRLERTLTLFVTPVGESPEPLRLHQVIRWPADTATMPEERAYLREGAFWGRTINLNVLSGNEQDDFKEATPDEIGGGKTLPYERFGKYLFGFPKPGFYNVVAKYSVSKSAISDTPPGAEQHKEWWTGDIQTNTITIQILQPGDR